MKTLFAVVLATLAVCDVAFAQTTPVDVGQSFVTVIQPYLTALLEALTTAAIAWVAYALKSKWGIDIDQGHRDAIQTWLSNQAGSLVADGAVKIVNGKVVVDAQVLNQHALQITQQIPDAAAYFAISPQLVAAKIVDKLPTIPAVASMMAAQPGKVN